MPDSPSWHWDEQAALREELANAAEAAATERDRLIAEVAYWRRRAERALVLARLRR